MCPDTIFQTTSVPYDVQLSALSTMLPLFAVAVGAIILDHKNLVMQ